MVDSYSDYTLQWVVHLFAGATAYPYIRDLMVLQSCTSLPPPHTELFEGGHPPPNLTAWEAALRRHPDKDFAVIWITSGHRTLSDQFRQLTGRIAHARTRCLRNERE